MFWSTTMRIEAIEAANTGKAFPGIVAPSVRKNQGSTWFNRNSRCILAQPSKLFAIQAILYTIWLFNIAKENGPFIDEFPIKTSIYKGFSMAMLNKQMVITGGYVSKSDTWNAGSDILTHDSWPCR